MLETIAISSWKLVIPENGLILHLDALNPRSFNGTAQWRDLSPFQNHIDLYGQILRDGQFLYPPLGSWAYGRTTNILQGIKDVSAITVFNVSYVPIPSAGFSGMLYEHTPDWNTVKDYNGVEYGGFGFIHHSEGSNLKPNTIHSQIRGTRKVVGETDTVGYAGSNFYTPDGTVPQVYAVIHDLTQTDATLITTPYVNGVEGVEDTVNPLTSGQIVAINNTFQDDHLFLFSRGGTTIFGENRLAALLIYNRRLSVAEINEVTAQLRRRFRL